MTGLNVDLYADYSDDELIFKAKHGDVKAFDVIHTRYLKKILNYVNRIVADFQKAERNHTGNFLAGVSSPGNLPTVR